VPAGLRAELCRIVRRLAEHGVADDDVGPDLQEGVSVPAAASVISGPVSMTNSLSYAACAGNRGQGT
jgi:hypothetical protein